MRRLVLLAVAVLLVFTPTCGVLNECYFDTDCDDDDPCTKDICDCTYVGIPGEFSWCSSDYSCYCKYVNECKSGDPDDAPGIGEGRLEEEIPDGGV